MPLELRPVDLGQERAEVTALLQRNLPDLDHARRFDWQYFRNPAGRAWSWFVHEKGKTRPVGVASLVPRRMWLHERIQLCGQVVDFAIDPGYRSLGPAVLLQRATFGPVDDGTLQFCYDCPPHDRGMATFRRLGLAANARMLRHARLLRVERAVRTYVDWGPAATVLSWPGNALLRAADRFRRRGRGIEVEIHSERFGEDFSRLDAEIGAGGVIRGGRGHEELNWRYRDDPLREYVVLTARRGGGLLAFAVLMTSQADAFLVDLFGRLTPEVTVALTEAAADLARRRGVQTFHAIASEHADVAPMLRRVGFHVRGADAGVVAYARAGGEVKAALGRERWSLTHAEIQA